MEQQTAELFSMQEAVNGMNGTLEFGAKAVSKTITANVSLESNIETHDDANSDSDLSIQEESSEVEASHQPNRKDKPLDRDSLLRKQVENQKLYQENSIKTNSEINQNLAGIQKYLKRSSDAQDRRYKLEKEKLQLKKDKLKFKKEKFEFEKQRYELEKETYEMKKHKYNFIRKLEHENSKRKADHLVLKQNIFKLKQEKNRLM